MSQQLTVIGQICTAIDKMQGGITESLNGTGINPDRFIATAKMAIQTHADRDRLEKADRQSLYLAIKRSASDGLLPDNREAALVVYGQSVQYQPMVQGLVKLARNSGEIESINSEVVFENDVFELSYTLDSVNFKHSPNWKNDRGQPVLVWATVKLKSGEVIARAYPKKRIDQIASRSKMAQNYDPAKGKDWEEFWRKAAIRNVLKYAPKSTAIENALGQMDEEFNGETIDQPPVVSEAAATETKRTRAAKIVTPEEPIRVETIDEVTGEVLSEEELPI